MIALGDTILCQELGIRLKQEHQIPSSQGSRPNIATSRGTSEYGDFAIHKDAEVELNS